MKEQNLNKDKKISAVGQQNNHKYYEITPWFSCNNNCIFCVNGNHKQGEDLNINQIFQMIEKAEQNDYRTILLMGGEPTIHENFFKILKFCKDRNLEVIVKTNGRMFAYETFCRKCKLLGLRQVQLSFHTLDKKTHAELTTIEGGLFQILQGLKNMIRYGITVNINTVVMKHNYKELQSIVRYLSQFKINNIIFSFINIEGRARDNSKELIEKMTNVLPYVIKAANICKSKKMSYEVEGIPRCLFHGQNYNTVDNYIKSFDYPNKYEKFIEITNKYEKQKINSDMKTKFPGCDCCIYDDKCSGVWKNYVELFGGDEFKATLSENNNNIKKPFIDEIRFEITPNCNLYCKFCYNAHYSFAQNGRKHLPELSTEKIKEILDQLKKQDINKINFLGGECFCRKDFPEIIKYAYDLGFFIKLTTNGLLINEENVKIINNYVKQTILSLHGWNPQLEASTTGNDLGVWQKKIEAINLLVRNQCKITIISIINKEKLNNLEEFLLFLRDLGIYSWIVLRPMPTKENISPFSKGDVKLLVDSLEKFENKYGQHIDIGNPIPLCSYDPEKIKKFLTHECFNNEYRVITINPLGDIVPCELVPSKIGNILNGDNIEECFSKSKIIQDKICFRNIPSKCKNCNYLRQCGGGCVAINCLGDSISIEPDVDRGFF